MIWDLWKEIAAGQPRLYESPYLLPHFNFLIDTYANMSCGFSTLGCQCAERIQRGRQGKKKQTNRASLDHAREEKILQTYLTTLKTTADVVTYLKLSYQRLQHVCIWARWLCVHAQQCVKSCWAVWSVVHLISTCRPNRFTARMAQHSKDV